MAAFLPLWSVQSVVLMSDNALIVTYLRHQDGTISRTLCLMASEITMWTERHLDCLSVRYIPGRKNILANQLSRLDQVLPMEWSLLPRVFEGICSVFGRPHLDLFATRANTKLPLYVFPVPNPLAWKQDAFQHPWDHLSTYAFLPFALLRQVLSRVLALTGLSLVLVALLWLQEEWFADIPSSRGRTSRTSTSVEPSCSATCEEVPSRPRDRLFSCMEVI